MNTEPIYEKWRHDRARAGPSADFSDRVMRAVDLLPAPNELPQRPQRTQGLLRISVCAAAVLAALFRVVELFSLFAASNLEN